MYNGSILMIIMFMPMAFGLTLYVHDSIVAPSEDVYLKTHEIILMIISVIMVLAIAIVDHHEDLSKEISASRQSLALNASNRPMYDINGNSSDGTYRVYLKSGETKTLSPKVVHVNRSKKSYLQTTRRLYFINLFGLRFKLGTYTENTLYLNDK